MTPRERFRKWPRLLPFLCALLLLSACSQHRPESIPILMYHHLAPDPGDDVWTVSIDEFRRQIADLKDAGYRALLPGDLAKRRAWKFWLPRKPVLITFDDGLLSTMTEAEPILREAGFRAICYLITGSTADTPGERMTYGTYECLSWEEVRAMQQRGTFVFGIHSHSHAGDPVRLAREAAACRQLFESKTHRKTRDYCYPYGIAPDVLVQAVSNAGYRTAMVCEDQMLSLAAPVDFFRIPRVSIYGGQHEFSVLPGAPPDAGAFCAEVRNQGVPLPVQGVLRDETSGRAWTLQPSARLGPQPQSWRWTNQLPDPNAGTLTVEIWEQNGLSRYFP